MATIFAVVVLLGSQVANVWGFRAQAQNRFPGLVFTGTLPLYLDDAAADWAFMRQAKEGAFLFSNPYTVDEHPRNYFNVLLWALGSVARLLDADVVAVYFAAKLVFGAILLAVLYRLARRLFDRPGAAAACFFMLVLAGGWEGPIAWLQRNAGSAWSASGPSWWMPEISNVFSLMLFPHLTAGFAAMTGVLLLMLRAWDPDSGTPHGRLAAAVGAGAILFLLTLAHPFDTVTSLVTIWVFPPLVGLVDRRWPRAEAGYALLATLVAAPAIAYDLWIVQTNPAIRAWHQQGTMPGLEPRQIVMALGVNGALALLVLPLLRRLDRPKLAMLAWLVSALALNWAPVHFQRRMMGGAQIPAAALACAALALVIVPWLSRALGSRVAVLVVAACVAPLNLVTPYYVHKQQWREIARQQYPSWLAVEEMDAIRALSRIAPGGAKAIASYEIGNFIPPFAGVVPYLGHGALTVDSRSRRADVERFYAAGPEDDAWRRELLARWGIEFVLYTPRERALGGFDPSARPWLREVYVAGEDPARRAAIYRVIR